MPKILRWKWTIITIVLLGSIVGLVGVPKSAEELKANLNKNIRLGLDLKGGAHIVFQIQVQDAFKAEADSVIDSLKEGLKRANVTYASMDRNDPASIEEADSIQIHISGVPVNQSADFRRVVTDIAGSQWIMASQTSTDFRL